MGNEKRRISFCPHCGNVASQQLLYEHEASAMVPLGPLGSVTPTDADTERYYLAVCETCTQPLLYFLDESAEVAERPYAPGTEEEPELDAFYYADLEWPSQVVPPGLPKKVESYFIEALRLKPISPTAFAVQIRRCLEAICDDRKAIKGRLEKRLKDLSLKSEIPPKLVELTEVMRVLGNIGAHDFDRTLSKKDASIVLQFFRSVVEYIYVAPHALAKYREMAKTFGKQTDEETTETVGEKTSDPEGKNSVVN